MFFELCSSAEVNLRMVRVGVYVGRTSRAAVVAFGASWMMLAMVSSERGGIYAIVLRLGETRSAISEDSLGWR
jgi:hypothetical protein